MTAPLAPRDATELAGIVRDAHAARTRLRFTAAGTWAGAGTPAGRIAPDARPVSLTGLAGIVAYVPADLTMTVRAGTTLAELDAATARHNQWCPLLPWGDDSATVGATFATATSGPCAAALGRPRDIAVGVQFVDGTGMIVRGGGRVVKNVAGFDLTRLMVGAFGTLGAITEVSLRLRARPAVDVTLLVTASGPDAAARLASIRRGTIAPLACELLDGATAAALGLPGSSALVRLGGNAALVAAARTQAAAAGDVRDADPAVWTRLRALDPHSRQLDGCAFGGAVASRIKARFDPARILNPGVFGEDA